MASRRRSWLVLSTRLERVVLTELLQGFGLAVVALTALLTVEMVYEAVVKGLPLASLVRFVPLMIPYALPWTIPAAFVAACLMVYSRMAASNELTVVRAAGVHVWRVLAPAARTAAVLCCLCGLLNHDLVPRTRRFQYNIVKASSASEYARAIEAADPVEPIIEVGEHKVWVGDLREDGTFRDILIVTDEAPGAVAEGEGSAENLTVYIKAPRGSYEYSDERSELVFHLLGREKDRRGETDEDPHAGLASMCKVAHGSSVYDFERAFFESGTYWVKLRSVHDLKLRVPKGKHVASTGLLLRTWRRDAEIASAVRQPPKRGALSAGEYEVAKKKYLNWLHGPREWRTEVHKRAALSLAPFLLGAIAVPIGVMMRRGQRVVAFGLAIGIVLVYYAVMAGGWRLGAAGMLPPAVAMWGVTLLVGAGGFVLIRSLFKR